MPEFSDIVGTAINDVVDLKVIRCLMNKLFCFFVLSCATLSFDGRALAQQVDLSRLKSLEAAISESSYKYKIRWLCLPREIATDGGSVNEHTAFFDITLHAAAWKPASDPLSRALDAANPEITTESGSFRSSFQIIDIQEDRPVFEIQLDSVNRIIACDGKHYKVGPQIKSWFEENLLPVVKCLNRGVPITKI